MKIVQINAVYEFSSTGRTTKEMHEWLDSFKVRNHENVKKFLAYCKEHFQGRMGDDVTW